MKILFLDATTHYLATFSCSIDADIDIVWFDHTCARKTFLLVPFPPRLSRRTAMFKHPIFLFHAGRKILSFLTTGFNNLPVDSNEHTFHISQAAFSNLHPLCRNDEAITFKATATRYRATLKIQIFPNSIKHQ